MHEAIHMRLVSHHTSILNETGAGKGTFNCNIVLEIHLSYTHAYLIFTAYPPGGVLRGHGEAAFYVNGPQARFKGTLTLSGGSGRYKHVSGTGLSLQGTLQRGTYALSATVTGMMSL